jgi:hypothetical protein
MAAVFSAGRVKVSQAEVVDKKGEKLSLGFSATLGWNEVKCIAAATLDLNSPGAAKGSAVEEEFFLYHTEGVESSGFCIHFKLPHYVTFQSSLDAMRDAKAKKAGSAGPGIHRPGAGGTGMSPRNDACLPHRPWAPMSYGFLDASAKREMRRKMLKAIAVPGCQMPYASREVPMARGWGTGGSRSR